MATAEHLRELLHSVWDLGSDGSAWSEAMVNSVSPIARGLGSDLGLVAWKYSFPGGQLLLEPGLRSEVGLEASDDEMIAVIESGPGPSDEQMASFYRGAPWSGLIADAFVGIDNPDDLRDRLTELGTTDSIGLMCGDARKGLMVQAISSTPMSLTKKQRWVLAGITAHMSSALRLRNQIATSVVPDEADGVLSADGNVLDASGDTIATLRDRLRNATLAQRDVRDGAHLTDAGGLEAWESLVDGRYSIVDYFEDRGKRLFLVFENPYFFTSPRALSPRQRDVVALAARGQNHQTIGLTLGLAASTVASHLATAMSKLGFASRADLVRYLAWEAAVVTDYAEDDGALRMLEVETQQPLDPSVLTDAERDVAQKAAAGATNDEIATARGSRPRTVANQLASIYSKLGVNSRLELASRFRDAD